MKPYLVENAQLAFLIEWGGLILVLALVLSPFLVIRLQRFKPTRWRHIVGAYVGSFVLFLSTIKIVDCIGNWTIENFINAGWIQEAITNLLFKEILLSVVIYPLLIFYGTKLVKTQFTKLNFFTSLFLSVVLFIGLAIILAYATLYFMGQAFMEHF